MPTHQHDPVPTTTAPTTDGAAPQAFTAGRDNKENRMTLTGLIDEAMSTSARGTELPCQENDPELWFAQTPSDVEFAKALCATCPLQTACLAGAIERSEPWGVWGGELFEQGAIIPRKRPRGRPRKHPVAAA